MGTLAKRVSITGESGNTNEIDFVILGEHIVVQQDDGKRKWQSVIFEMFLRKCLYKNTTCAALGTFLPKDSKDILVMSLEDLLEQ